MKNSRVADDPEQRREERSFQARLDRLLASMERMRFEEICGQPPEAGTQQLFAGHGPRRGDGGWLYRAGRGAGDDPAEPGPQEPAVDRRLSGGTGPTGTGETVRGGKARAPGGNPDRPVPCAGSDQ